MEEQGYRGKTLSFLQLLSEQKIEIPIIQRDYAQGRADKTEIRNNFLNALLESLSESKPIKLDFIYGSKKDGVFQPLDGQQRLTTLFLLHWYAAIKDGLSLDMYSETLRKFSYETRISSREFCESLIANPVEVKDELDSLSDEIVNSAWFFLSWKKDPTIEAMLRTIDDIHLKFNMVDSLWSKLKGDNSLVTFYHVNLEDIGLTDDLYIKMNARGKLLTPFENFKAGFEKYIIEKGWETQKNFVDTFAFKVDTVWTDLFWKHRTENNVDKPFIRFISTIAMISAAVERKDNRLTNIASIQDNSSSVKPEMFTKIGFNYLIRVFEIYEELKITQEELKANCPFFQHKPEKNIFDSIVYEGTNASYTQKVVFYAQTEYLLRNESFESEKFQDWIRVIRNIICRGDVTKNGERPAIIRSPQTFDGVINLISELAEGCTDIYNYLSTNSSLKSTFAKEQLEEERIKSKIIIQDVDYKKSILTTEDTNLLQGRIDFALYCINYKANKNNFNVDLLNKVNNVLITYFNKESHLSNDLRRAFLTIEDNRGNFNYYGYWWSFWNVVSANKRCLIDKYRELEYYIYGNYKNKDDFKIYPKKLILKLVDNNLREIIDSFIPPFEMPVWKQRLISESPLLDDKSKSNFIAIPDDETCCYLLKSMRPRDIEGCEKIE